MDKPTTARVRVRFAPSPTGPLHIGGVRTALYNYLFAKQHQGDFILRIEDTDSNRFVPGAEAYIIDALQWLGITPNEGVGVGGPHAPYRQSERKAIYKTYIDQLLASGNAYIAFDTPAELEKKRAANTNFQYDASTRLTMTNSLTLSAAEVHERLARNEPYVVRFKVEPGEEVAVHDLIRGEVCIQSAILDDKVLFKSADQLPTYHLANIVDDHLMEISHVIRGEEWLPSAPLHVLLYRALGWEDTMPAMAHLPLLLKPDGKGKLSKRDGDRLGFPVFPCEWTDPVTGEKSSGYREAGYFPQAIVNFLALLGWNPGDNREIMSMDELIESFSLERCSKSGAHFDFEKVKWFNHQYLQQMTAEELFPRFCELLQQQGLNIDEGTSFPVFERSNPVFSKDYVLTVIDLLKPRATFIPDLWEQGTYFFKRPDTYAEKVVQKYWKEGTGQVLNAYADLLESYEPFTMEALETMTNQWIADHAYKSGHVYNALRLTLVGDAKGPRLFDIIVLIGRTETIYRIRQAIQRLDPNH